MILQDNPIQKQSQDELGRISMVELIANSIIEFSKKSHPCTNLGIYGAWGCGKTSMINLIQNYLVTNGNHDNIAIVHFNPWQAGSTDLLMGEFFKCICKDLEEDLRNYIKKYGDIISFATRAIPVVGEPLAEGIKNVKDALSSSENTLKEQKDKISKAIKKSKKHLLVFIDDLDRLDKEELHAVFRLIRQMADFDNTMYVIAMDVDMASKSIAQYYGGSSIEDGRRFIDKIIQVPINIPVIQKPFLKNYLMELMRGIIKPYTHIEESSLMVIAEKVSDLFETKRDCIRFINQLRFVFPSVAKEVNVHDFCLLEAIKVISQDAYMKILYNKNAMLKTPDIKELLYMENKKDVNDLLNKRFQEALDDISKDLSVHNIGNKIRNILENDLFLHNSIDTFQLIDQQKLQSNIYFDKYFVLAVPEHLIPDLEMDLLKNKILSMSYESLSNWIDEKCKRYSYEEIQRASLRVIRKFNEEEKRCKATQLFCEALSISKLAKGYNPDGYKQKQTDIFVTTTLIPRYMIVSKKAGMETMYEVDATYLNKTLSTIYDMAEFNYCMQIHYGVNKLPQSVIDKTITSFNILKEKFVSLPFSEQIKIHKELLTSFYSYWNHADNKGMTEYLTQLTNQNEFQTDFFINKFIVYNGDATVIDQFVGLFKDVIPILANKINENGKDYALDSPVRMFMANYKEALKAT